MTLDELLTKERQQYIATYNNGIDGYRFNKFALEIMIRTTADQNRHQAEIFQVNRYDLVTANAEGKLNLTEFNLDKDSLLKYDNQAYNIDGMTVEVIPFVWNGCELTLDNKPNDAYITWAKKWMDFDDNTVSKPDSFMNVIHSVTFPEEKNGKWEISIDFGTAPIEAFKELLTVLSRQGVKSIQVHSSTFTN